MYHIIAKSYFLYFRLASNDYSENEEVFQYLRNEVRTGYIKFQCQDYLNEQTYSDAVCFDTGEYSDALELYASSGSATIQNIIDYQDADTICLRRPAPGILPLIISKITNDSDSYVIPSDIINIHVILPHSPRYQLEAIICDVNQCRVVFMKNLSTNKWYYYQNNYECEQLSESLSNNLNYIIESRSTQEQARLIKSAHFLISLIFHNVVKYVYKQEE